MKHRILYLALLGGLTAIFLVGCGSGRSSVVSGDELYGRMLLWHTFTGIEAEALNEVVTRFQEIHPDVTIRQQEFEDVEELIEAFLSSVDSGLGPDLIIVPATQIHPLAAAQAIDPIGSDLPEDFLQRYTPGSVSVVTYNDDVYGLPLSLNTLGLYVNRNMVDEVAETIEELEEQAAQGKIVLMATNFADSFWGVQAFGGRLLNDEGRVILNQGGFANWLAWMKAARDAPGMILDSNREVLRSRFINREAAYYIGSAAELNDILEALGSDTVGVSLLPNGPIGSAGPFLGANTFLFSNVSSSNQRLLALEFAKLATNSEQGAALMRRANLVPANANVRINPRLNPIVSSFASQARTAVPIPNIPQIPTIIQLANDTVARVLEGLVEPAEAAIVTTDHINTAIGFPAEESASFPCTGVGTIHLLHSWNGDAAVELDRLVTEFRSVCPFIIVESEYEELGDFKRRIEPDTASTARPDLLLAPQAWFYDIVTEQSVSSSAANVPTQTTLLKDISPLVNGDTLQPYRPIAVDAMRYNNNLYGLPVSVRPFGLYYNRNLVTAPPLLLDDLRVQASASIPIVLDRRFVPAYWGVPAFGGVLFDDQFSVMLDAGGLTEWLTWLVDSNTQYGIGLSDEPVELRRKFVLGESAYYVGEPSEIPALRTALGEDNLGAALLPSGPEGSGRPLATATGFFFPASSSDIQTELALEFAKFVTNAANQQKMAAGAAIVPANAIANIQDFPILNIFAEQAQTAILVPNRTEMRAVVELGDDVYEQVFTEGVAPADAVAAWVQEVNQRNGIESTPTPEPDAQEDEQDQELNDAQESTPTPTEETSASELPTESDTPQPDPSPVSTETGSGESS